MPHELDLWRDQIDQMDAAILALLQARARLVAQIWAWKRSQDVALHDPHRERALLDRLLAANAGSGLEPAVVEAVFRAVIGASAAQPEASSP